MIRFRSREDEQRYVALVSEVYRIIAGSLPPAQVSVAMRNLGKLQDLLMLEGVRQGVAAAAISNLAKRIDGQDLEHLKAFQLHAHVYGSQDTPLRDVEQEWVGKLSAPTHEAEVPWLDPDPMRFAPDTEQAFEAEMRRQQTVNAWGNWQEEDVEQNVTRPRTEDDDGFDLDAVEAMLDEPSDGSAQEQPQLLDRIRDELQTMQRSGIHPRDWKDLILRLHLQLHVDAGALDLQLGTPMGQTVLAQAGFVDLQPGAFGTNLQEIYEEAARPVNPPQVAAATQTLEVAPPDDGSSPEDE